MGYVHFRNFVQPSVEALNTAFAQLREAGARPSSCSTCATTAAGSSRWPSTWPASIAGPRPVGQVFVQFTHNDKQSSRNTAYRFEAKPQALGRLRGSW